MKCWPRKLCWRVWHNVLRLISLPGYIVLGLEASKAGYIVLGLEASKAGYIVLGLEASKAGYIVLGLEASKAGYIVLGLEASKAGYIVLGLEASKLLHANNDWRGLNITFLLCTILSCCSLMKEICLNQTVAKHAMSSLYTAIGPQ